jgi:hypothetical protein
VAPAQRPQPRRQEYRAEAVRRADADRAGQGEIGLADPRSGELAESGIDAVDRAAFAERAIEEIVARFDVVPSGC